MLKLRKMITVSVMAMTVFVMSGLGSLVQAASAQPGDLVKAAGNKTVYYLGSDSKLYNIPNEDTYFSWYKDWSGVITISVTDLNSYGNGIPAGFVTMRPGTRLIKRDVTTDDTMYAVETNGTLRPITAANAIGLYGSSYTNNLTKVSDQNFLSYTVGTQLPTGQYPIGTLLKKTTGADVYYFDGVNYRHVATEAAFNANRFNARFIVKTSMNITAGGTAITGMESNLINAAQNGGNIVTPPVVTGSGLTASLNANTPAGVAVPATVSRLPMMKVNLTAANDGAVTVNTITVKRIGLSDSGDIKSVWAEVDGDIIASKKTVNSSNEATLVFSPAFTIAAGSTKTIDIIAELTGASGNIGLSIVSASAINATAGNVSGSFPISGNLMSPVTYNVTTVTVDNEGSTGNVSTIDVGEEGVELGSFDIDLTDYKKDVTVRSIKLKNIGTESLSDVVNGIYLESDSKKIANGVIDGKYITFTFNEGVVIAKNDNSRTFTIYGNVIGKELVSGSNVILVFNKSEDLIANETSNGFGVVVKNTTLETISTITISAGAISIAPKSTNPADEKVLPNQKGIVALLANIRADEFVSAEGIKIKVLQNASTSFENISVFVNGNLIDSFDAASGTSTKEIESSISLNKGDNEVKVTVDTISTATTGHKFEVQFDATDDGTVDGLLVDAEYANGNAVAAATIDGSATSAELEIGGVSASIVRTDGYADTKTIVQGATNVSLGKFTVKAFNDDVTITKITVASSTLNELPYSSIKDVKVMVGGTQVGSTKSFTSSGVSLTGLSAKIKKDSTEVIEVFASVDSNNTGNLIVDLSFIAKDSNGDAVTIAKQTTVTYAVTDEGTLTIARDGNTPDGAILASKVGVEQAIASFKLTATNDIANVTELTVKNASTTDVRIASYKLYNSAGKLLSTANPFSGTTEFAINNNDLKINANASEVVTVKVVLNDIVNNAAATNKELTLTLAGAEFKSSNSSNNVLTNAPSGGIPTGLVSNTFYIRKTVPTVALLALPNSTLTSGTQVISKFTISADANADVKISKLVVKVNASASTTLAATTVNGVKVNGASKSINATATPGYVTVDFGTTTPEIVSAGTTKTFEIVSELTVLGSNRESLSTSIAEASYSAGVLNPTYTFLTWSDSASNIDVENVWFNSYRVNGLPTNTQTMSTN